MAGWMTALVVHARFPEASRLASELSNLLESIGEPTLTVALLYAALLAKYQAGEMAETLLFAQRIIGLADGDPHKATSSSRLRW
jgi:adenylate cyclase